MVWIQLTGMMGQKLVENDGLKAVRTKLDLAVDHRGMFTHLLGTRVNENGHIGKCLGDHLGKYVLHLLISSFQH